jgi:hypothetical protein
VALFAHPARDEADAEPDRVAAQAA